MTKCFLAATIALALIGSESGAIPMGAHPEKNGKAALKLEDLPPARGSFEEDFSSGKSLGHEKFSPALPPQARVPEFVSQKHPRLGQAAGISIEELPAIAIPGSLPEYGTVPGIETPTVRIPDTGSTFLLLAGSIGCVALLRFCIARNEPAHHPRY
jgi:hypothetical protein